MKHGRLYKNGAAFEYQIINSLKAKGYTTMRAAGSHGPIDILAIQRGGAPKFIQAKAGYISGPEVERLRDSLISLTGYHTCYVLTRENWKAVIEYW